MKESSQVDYSKLWSLAQQEGLFSRFVRTPKSDDNQYREPY